MRTASESGRLLPHFGRPDWLVLAGLVLGCGLVFANAIGGAFVYDDSRQIVDNPLIQDSRHYATALTSDVWAFKGESEEAWSNYWRPTFTLWTIANYRLFGSESTAGWHVANIFLHALVTCLGFLLMRFLGASTVVAGSAALVFAVHPVHVESVAWISGSPDLLMAIGCLGALWLALAAARKPDWRKHLGALVLLAFSLGAKEVAVVFPLLLFVAALATSESGTARERITRAALLALPYLLLCAAWFAVRIAVLGTFSKADDTDVSLLSMVLTAPELGAFYLRQAFAPFWLGPSYPLRTVTPGNLGLANFWAPLVVCLVAAALALWAMRRGALQVIGVATFALLLLPAFNVDAFIAEHIAHDRYLYLPLLGLLMIVVPTLASLGTPRSSVAASKVRAAGISLVAFLGLVLGYQSYRYNQVWLSDLALWQRGTHIDPSSEFNWTQLGYALDAAGRTDEALQALDRGLRSLEASSTPDALLKRAELAAGQGRFEDAAQDLNLVLQNQPQNLRAYEQLALILQQNGQINEAARVLLRGRERAPAYDCELSSNLAVLLYLGGDRARALAELERIRGQALRKISPGCRAALFRLGQLYLEMGRLEEARTALRQYLEVTSGALDEATRRFRAEAQRHLQG